MAGRPSKQTADYFPHFVSGGKTLHALEKRYGNDGYAFWYKLLEALSAEKGHYLDLSDDAEMIYQSDHMGLSEDVVIEILDLLVRLGKVDRELWENRRIVWVQKLVDNLAPLYNKREGGVPSKPDLRDGNHQANEFPERKYDESDVSGADNTQIRLDKIRGDEIRESAGEEARASEDDSGGGYAGLEEPVAVSADAKKVTTAMQRYGWRLDDICPGDRDTVEDLLNGYPAEWITEAIKRGFKQGHRRDWAYVRGILRNFQANGGPDDIDAGRSPPGNTPGLLT